MKIENSPAASAGKPATDKIPDDIKQVGDGFEGMFAKMLLEEMRKTTETPDEERIIPKSGAERIYESMLDQEYAEKMGKQGSMGISKIVAEQLMNERKGR